LARDFTSEEIIFKEGDPGDGVYVVRQGEVQIAVIIGDLSGFEITKEFLEKMNGIWFGSPPLN